MKKIILHVGPPKCGSSSIQHFFLNHKEPCLEKTSFIRFDQRLMRELNCPNPASTLLTEMKQYLENHLASCDVLILSREGLFQCAQTIKHVCDLSEPMVSDIRIIGYVRRQSDLIISSYAQWHFRSAERVKEAKTLLQNSGIEPSLFTGLERQLISCVIDDFHSARLISGYSIVDWSTSYGAIESLIEGKAARIYCGLMPRREASKNLIEDFCEKADIHLKEDKRSVSDIKKNASFNLGLVEAICNGAEFDLDIPGPHKSNSLLQELSAKMTPIEKQNDQFILLLKGYTDAFFWKSNSDLSKTYDIARAYFEEASQLTKEQVLEAIKLEEQKRASGVERIAYYKKLTALMAETCLKAMETSPVPASAPPVQNEKSGLLSRVKGLAKSIKTKS